MYLAFVGLDLGQTSDPSALIYAERPQWSDDPYRDAPGFLLPSELDTLRWIDTSRRSPELHVRGLKRFPLGTSYPSIVLDVAGLLERLPYPEQTALVIDHTGCGRPVYDMFGAAGLDPIGVSIHGGDQVVTVDGGFRVPKRDLVGSVQSMLGRRCLKFAADLPLLDVLKGELRNFRYKLDPRTAHDSYSAWRENLHDDCVFAVSLAAWLAERPQDSGCSVVAFAPPARVGSQAGQRSR